MDRYRFFLGALIVVALLALAIAVALGEVKEASSYGLMPVLTILAKVALDFSEWTFRVRRDDPEKTPEPPKVKEDK